MKLSNVIKHIWGNFKKRGLKDILNPKKWWIVIDASLAEYYGLTLAKAELVVYRSLMCPKCVEKGECIHCSCGVPENMYSEENWCSGGNWGPEDAVEFQKRKKMTGLQFQLTLKQPKNDNSGTTGS